MNVKGRKRVAKRKKTLKTGHTQVMDFGPNDEQHDAHVYTIITK